MSAAPDRQAPAVDGALPAGQVARVLAEAITDMTDRTHAEPDQVAIRVRRVAHEVSLHLPALARAASSSSGNAK